MQASLTMAAIVAGILLLAGAAAPSRGDTVYVSNEQDNTISVIDGTALKVVATLPVGRRPRGIALSVDGKRLYVAAGDDNRLDVVDLAQRKVVEHLPSGDDPEAFAVHPDGRHLYVANENDNLVSVVDTVDRRIVSEIAVGVEPEGMAVSPDGKLAVNTSETTSMAHFIDVSRGELIDNVLVDTRPRYARFTPDGKRVWVSSEVRGTVTVIDVETRDVIRVIEFGVAGLAAQLLQPVGIIITRDGQRAFVALGPANRVAEIDPGSFAVRRYHLVGQRVWHLALSSDEKRLYTTNGNSGDVSVIDLVDNRVIQSIATGRAPWGVVVAP